MTSETSPTVLVASEDAAFLDEIVRYLDQIPSWRLVTCAGSAVQAWNALEAHLPDAALICDGLAIELPAGPGERALDQMTLIVLGRSESAAALKAALRLGARAFVEWPADRQSLQGLVERNWASRPPAATAAGNIYCVWAPKGGSGASTVAAHLAGCLGALGAECILADLDLQGGDQRVILGLEGHAGHIGDLVRMGSELSANVIDEVSAGHPGGFRAILASHECAAENFKPADLTRTVAALRDYCEFTVADLPSGLGESAFAVMDHACSVYLVLTPDLLSVRRAAAAVKTIRAGAPEVARLEIILNQTGHGALSAKDVEHVVGLPVVKEVKAEMDIYQAANRGRLSDTGKRALNKLARSMMKSSHKSAEPRRALKWR